MPEFHVSQNSERAQVLELIRDQLGCGYIKRNGKKDRVMVLVVRNREHLLQRVIPFFERSPLLSAKQADFEAFARVVRAMESGQHRTPEGFQELLVLAVSTNGNGRFRRYRWTEIIDRPESSETVRRSGYKSRKIQSELHGDMQSQAEMTWPPQQRE